MILIISKSWFTGFHRIIPSPLNLKHAFEKPANVWLNQNHWICEKRYFSWNNLYKKIGSYLILCIASVLFLTSLLLMICSAQWWQYLAVWGTGPFRNISMGKYLLTSCFNTAFLKSFGFTLRYNRLFRLCSLYLFCGLAGFALEIYHDREKDMLFKVVLFAMMISITPLMVPLFQMYYEIRDCWHHLGLMARFLPLSDHYDFSTKFPWFSLWTCGSCKDWMEYRKLGIFFRIYLPCNEKHLLLRYDHRIFKRLELLSVGSSDYVWWSENTYDGISDAGIKRK